MVAIIVGDFNKGDTSIQITGLKPGNYYNIRVLATNTANFTTQGSLIRLRTIPAIPLDEDGTLQAGNAASQDKPAAVHATSTPFEAAFPSPPSRESNNAQLQTKRTVSGRRNSPVISGAEQSVGQSVLISSSDEDESPEAIQKLTERLDFLRSETERTDRETAEEEEESKRQLAELTKERDRLKQEYKEKEEASAELRRHGNHLDKLNRTAQSKKAAKEKQLQQKKADRQRVKDDIARWEKETIEMNRETEEMIKEKAEIIAAKDREVSEIKEGMVEDLAVIKTLEEDIRVKGTQIKTLEKEHERINSKDSGGQEHSRLERDNDQAWEARMQAIQAQLGSLWQTLQHAQQEQQQAEEHLSWWMTKRAKNPESFAPTTSLDFATAVHRSRSQRSRQPNSRTSTISSPSTSYQNGPTAFNNSSALSPPFAVGSAIFNMGNGMTVPPLAERAGMSQADVEVLTSSGAVSPAASNLLPSNLFRDDDVATQRFSDCNDQDARNGSSDLFLGHAMTHSDASALGPYTPGSANSRAGSILSSPHESSQNLQGFQFRPEPFVESDQRSIHSTNAPLSSSITADSNTLATSKLAHLFTSTFTRQRGKPGTQEPPLLGTLKQGQSQSFPRNSEQDTLDPNGHRRRKGSYGNWANPMAGLLTRNTSTPGDSGFVTAPTASGRRSRLNMFGLKMNSLDSAGFGESTSSSRPSSTYSYDQILARPSSDSQRFGWSVPDSIPSRNSPLGAHSHWSGGPWSRAPSRRPSVQHGSTSNLSVGSTPLDPDSYPGFSLKQSTEQAPIGTQPRSSQRAITPRLNPAAPTFKTLFIRGDAKKSARGEKFGVKTIEKSKDRDSEKEEIEEIESTYESSPQNPRLSRDAQSITTATSTADSHDSFDRSTSGTPSEAMTPSGPKETLMQKITRKSSSSKFNVPWAKERGLFSKRAGEPSPPGEIDEDTSSETHLGKSLENSNSTPQQEKAGRSSLSWPNIRRKSKKGDQALAEAAERGSEGSYDDDA